MRKSFTNWCTWLIVIAFLSLFFPFVSVVALILLFSKKKYFANALDDIENIADAASFSSKLRADADTYATTKKTSADEYYVKQKNLADTKRAEANTYFTELKERADAEKAAADKYYSEKTAQAKQDLDMWEHQISQISSDISDLKNEKAELLKEIEDLSKEDIFISIDFDVDETITSEEYKNKLTILKSNLSDLVRNDLAVLVDPNLTKKVMRNNSKQIIRCFEAEGNSIIKATTTKNIDTQRNKLARTFETLNRIFDVDGVELTKEMLEMKLEELNLTYAFQLKKEQEREEQKAIREQMLEEEKVRREIEREKSKIEKEEHQFKNEISKLMGYLQKSSEIEKQLYINKIRELEEKLKLVEKDKENVLEREQNTRAGYVYVISNIGSFGEDIYKIGMTRRLEPMDRVKELGDASVPFEFDVHAMIFSEDAPALETTLHNTFRDKQVNKVNPRKEFFRVTLPEIEKVVKENHNAAVAFTQIAKAEQYRESLRLAEAANQ